ncbi:hypothetical protein Calkro_0313 [Caldicellulosiruptor kronotskyensis 2002]|uniref:SLH domain-containing protein n=1 Tax=Caldicellulosiruptor kronotskyensis (strain DSM 18902 / VKM B-2412 / 2002) TaxID=632348 RepID=E4SDM7_CALK2|nr:hypothetical protein [Caldicellulosiruptor kronotskyensis]ADQ45220.1 hypothetical protein Calkro_0313 [Caldicellulosiruptor kronotskyensis 2002]
MKKLLSFAIILSLLLSLAFPVAQARTITQKVQAAINKIDYITAGEFVTSLLLGANVKPNGIADYWGKAQTMGLIPGEVKKDKPLTRAQASYIVWKLINAVPELKDKNIPVKTEILTPWDLTLRGRGYLYDYMTDLDFVLYWSDLLIIDYYYADGRVKTKYVWDVLKGYVMRDDYAKFLQDFAKKCPDKLKFAPKTEGGYIKYDKEFKSYYYQLSFDPKSYYPILIRTKDSGGREWNIAYDPRANKYLEEYIKNHPRKFALDHTRFAQMADDYTKIPQAYREPMLRLADLGIITPEMSPLYVSKIRFNPAKMLTRAEAVAMISRVFDESKREVYDEFKWQLRSYVDMKTGIKYYWDEYKRIYRPMMSIYNKNEYDRLESSDTPKFGEPILTFRMDEMKLLARIKQAIKNVSDPLIGDSFVRYSFAGLEFIMPWVFDSSIIPWEDKPFYRKPWYYKMDFNYLLVPLAYKKEAIADAKHYTNPKTKLPADGIVKWYGDVCIWYVNLNGEDNVGYWCTTNPTYKGYFEKAKVLYAKPDPNIK